MNAAAGHHCTILLTVSRICLVVRRRPSLPPFLHLIRGI